MSLGAICIGQEVAVTPLQLINAVSAIANGGLLLRPRVVKMVWDERSKRPVKKFEKCVLRHVISAKTCRQLTDILVGVVERGTGRAAAQAGYRIAGKTGTAQKIDPATGTYAKDKWVATFLGYAPAYQPRIAMVIVLDEPERGQWAGEVAAPVFGRIAYQILKYLKVSPTKGKVLPRPRPQNSIRLASLTKPKPKAKNRIIILPDVRGKSMREVINILISYNLQVQLQGSGLAIDQEPPPGTKVAPGSVCRISFSSEL